MIQGWEFAHWFSELIAFFFAKKWVNNEQISDLLKNDRSFLVSDLSESLTVAHLIWAIWANEQMNAEQMSDEQMSEFPTLEQPERIA